MTPALVLLPLVVCLVSPAPVPEPDLATPLRAADLVVYPDSARPGRYYYPPGELRLGENADGEPELRLLQMRYTGTLATGDQGTLLHRSVLAFEVVMDGPGSAALEAARRALRDRDRGRPPDLRPLPIARLEAALVFTPLGGEDEETEPGETPLPPGSFRASDGDSPREGYWRERIYSLALDAVTSQAIAAAIERGGIILSVGYAFLARGGASAEEPGAGLSGTPELVRALRERLGLDAESHDRADLDAGNDATAQAPNDGLHLVHADVLAIRIDGARAAEIVRQIDINEGVPPGYAALDVYCFDFRDELRADLYEKWVEIRAHGVGGRSVSVRAIFSRDAAELYSASVRFPVSVRLDRPYEYRITEITQEGGIDVGEWVEASNWTDLLDVTTRAAAGTRPVEEQS